MSVAMRSSRAQVWLENLDDWSWPGRGAAAVEVLPPSWVPTLPPRLEPVAAGVGAASEGWQRRRAIAPWLGTGALLSALLAACALLALGGPLRLERIIGLRAADQTSVAGSEDARAAAGPAPPPVTLTPVSHDATGSSIDTAS